ncbi:AAA family ATPase [Citrobacter portucalensis]|uniref:nSTAND1 domain-containing NTPase n=1 Tax=Citrobacter portucalensis TaxID=1639133 RepID=UPI00019B062A|nr:AAA family ATPase [Citrobacter portucalensis]EEH91755.1 hypothetical protein CSAG_00109 [Citrobacter portucalensis]MDE9687523.1 AAA family ATPase [Citrobacter portucalensis]WOU48931.1 AAA family ATPase [Citrobacter portucalensis]
MISPFVGPGPFGPEQILFGRDNEIEELHNRLIADRIIILYSPSGAGKTSLLQAKNGLLQRFKERFHLLPILRISGGAHHSPVKGVLEQLSASGYGKCSDGDTLETYFERFLYSEGNVFKRVLMVIDQFEEIFLSEISAKEREEFFIDLGNVLSRYSKSVWIVFSMREEYFPWLDDYRDLIPTGLECRVRLSLLSFEQAIEAIREPAKMSNIILPKDDGRDAAEYIVEELSKFRKRMAGEIAVYQGTIEPVLLQVVCTEIWNDLSVGGQSVQEIRIADVRQIQLDAILQNYCEEVLEYSVSNLTRGRCLREWIENKLLTPGGLRTPAMIESSDINSPQPDELEYLISHHLIRRQIREDGDWYELSHDSLSLPIKNSIEKWQHEHLAEWQRLASQWHIKGRRKDFFSSLPGRVRLFPRRARILSLESNNTEKPSEIESAFIDAYQDYSYSWWSKITILFMVLGFTMWFAIDKHKSQLSAAEDRLIAQRDLFNKQQKIVLQRENDTLQTGLLNILGGRTSLELRALAAATGAQFQEASNGGVRTEYRGLLANILFDNRYILSVESPDNDKSKVVAINEDYRVIAQVGKARKNIQVFDKTDNLLWNIDSLAFLKFPVSDARVITLVRKYYLAIGDSQGKVALCDIRRRECIALNLAKSGQEPVNETIRGMSFANDFLIVSYADTTISAWRFDTLNNLLSISINSKDNKPRAKSIINALTFIPGQSAFLDAGHSSQGIKILNVSGGGVYVKKLPPPQRQAISMTSSGEIIYSVAVSPDGRFIAAGNRAGNIHLWDITTLSQPKYIFTIKNAHEDVVSQIKFLQDGSLLSAGWDGQLKRWSGLSLADKSALLPQAETLLGLPHQITSIAIRADKREAFITTEKGSVLKVTLADEHHPFGIFYPNNGRLVGFEETRNGTQLNWITSGRLESIQPEYAQANGSKPQVRAELTDVEHFASADRAGIILIRRGETLMALRHDSSTLQVVKGVYFSPDEKVLWMKVNDTASLLMIDRQVRDKPPRLWILSTDTMSAVECLHSIPIGFRAREQLSGFRPHSKDFLSIDALNDQITLWQETATDAQGCPIYVANTSLQNSASSFPLPKYTLNFAFSPSGEQFYQGNYLGQIYPIAIKDGTQRRELIKDDSTSISNTLAVLQNKTVAMGDRKGRLWLYSSNTMLPIEIKQQFHHSAITALAISSDGRWMASGSQEGIALWDLRIDTWIQRACDFVPERRFSDAQNSIYFPEVKKRVSPCEDHGEKMTKFQQENPHALAKY